jgi:peptidoglycan/LPS O-acetylase OafA/YrhL
MNKEPVTRTKPWGWWLFAIGFAIAGLALAVVYGAGIPESSPLFRILFAASYVGGFLMLAGWAVIFMKSMERSSTRSSSAQKDG